MKNRAKTVVFIIAAIFALNLVAQAKESKLPSAKVENLQHRKVDSKNFENDGKPFFILFWATWCKPCLEELEAVDEVYDKWKKETGVKVIAVSVDDSRNARRVAPFVKGRDWDFEVYLDKNQDLKRAMNVNNPPHSFLVNGEGEIVWEHNGYAPGGENEMYKQLKKLIK